MSSNLWRPGGGSNADGSPEPRERVRHLRDGWAPSDCRRRYTFGVDFGQAKNYSALALLEKRWKWATPDEFQRSGGLGYNGEWLYTVVKLERVELGTPYTAVAEWILDSVKQLDERLPRTVVLDGTGVGTAVKDTLRSRGLKATLVNAVITGGDRPGYRADGQATYVARAELMTRLAVAIENGEFSVAASCKNQGQLMQELRALKRRGKPEGGVQDDLAFALALAVWWGLK